ncbi:MAG: ribulose-phosphate 3-epimerase [Firmicutes bacterium]|nr:ribulose-phosphate 3-epimerase [Bacillota bacterium]
MKIKISPSVLSCDFSKMGDDMNRVAEAGAEYVHLDVMDGMFVPNISFGAPVIKCCRPVCGLVFDTHLMINEPIRYIDDFVKAGSDIITVHTEACSDCAETLRYIRSCGVKAGVTIKPATPVSVLEPLVGLADMILIMSVEPGFGGQKFILSALDKIKQARALTEAAGLDTDIEVDGGITPENAAEVIKAGANVIVAGSAVFKAANMSEAVKALRCGQ